jgi:hypothetical protein
MRRHGYVRRIALPPGQILGPTRMHQIDLDPFWFEYFLHRNPIHPGGLHRHRADAAGFQPSCHPLQLRRPRPELLYRLRISPRRYRRKVTPIAHLNPGCIRGDNLPARICRVQPLLQFLPLWAVPLAAIPQSSKVDIFLFAMAYSLCFGICQARLSGPYCTNSPTGSSLAFSALSLATNS